MSLLPLGFLALGFFWPLWEVLRLGLQVEGRWTISRLGALLGDPYVRHLLLFTLEQALLSTLLSLLLGFPLGWLLTRYEFPGKGAVRAFTLVPFVLPPITVALGFILFFGNQGYLNRFLMGTFGLSAPPIRFLYTLWGIVLAHAFYNAPVFARFVNAAWEGLDPGLTEAAKTLGARPLWAFLTVTLPLLAPAILSAFALVFVLCFLSFAIPLSLGGARYATVEVGVYLFARVYVDFPRAAALALLELGFSLLLTYFYILGGGRFLASALGQKRQTPVPLISRRHPRRLFWLPYLILAAAVFLGPIGAVVADSFTRPGVEGPLGWYALIFSPAQSPFIGASPLGSVLLSLGVAAGATIFALVLGILLSWLLGKIRIAALEALLMAPMAVSSVVLGLALLLGFRVGPLSALGQGPWVLVLAHTLIVYPFVVRTIRPLWEGLDPTLVLAARTLGAGRFSAFRTVELPLLQGGILVAGAFAFALSLGEMTAATMLSRPGMVTMPLAIYHFLSARRFGAASAMATLLILTTALAVWAWERLGGRLIGSHGRA